MFVVGLATVPYKRSPVNEMFHADITRERGIVGNRHGQRTLLNQGRRQVTIICGRLWEQVCAELGVDLPWHTRRANVCIDNINCGPASVGVQIRLGADVVLEVTGECDPCKRMNELHPALKDALTPGWRGGLNCSVLVGGRVNLYDDAEILWGRYKIKNE